jgi:hypothetical protein
MGTLQSDPLSLGEIETLLAASDPNRAACFYSLCSVLLNSIYASDYEPDQSWAELIVPTEFGSELLRNKSNEVSGLTESAKKLGLFLTFYHHSMLIDMGRMRLEPIRQLINDEFQKGRLLSLQIWPHSLRQIQQGPLPDRGGAPWRGRYLPSP